MLYIAEQWLLSKLDDGVHARLVFSLPSCMFKIFKNKKKKILLKI